MLHPNTLNKKKHAFLSEWIPLQKGDKTVLADLSFLKVYQLHVNDNVIIFVVI